MNTIPPTTPLTAVIALAGLVLLPNLVVAQELPGPAPEHALLKAMDGTWDATIQSPQGESKGTMTCRMECGGLWLASEFKADFGGVAFSGRGLDGYDPGKKKYVSVWVDSMNYRPMVLEGETDETGKILTLVGKGTGFDGQPVKFKSVTRHVDDDHMEFKIYVVGEDGSENEMMTTRYTRRK